MDMWKDYLSGLLKNNRSSGLSIRLSALISALLLSLLCGLGYQAWKYEVERIILEEGGWQSQIVGELGQEDIETIKKFATVTDVAINEKESKGEETAVEIYFENYRDVLADTPRIARLVGVPLEQVAYHYELLAMYFIRDQKDTAPRLLFPMFLVITAMASLSLIVMIHHAFAVSMNARIHQFGIFSSIGATPRQIRACLLQEAAALCAVPILIGNLLGIAGSVGWIQLFNFLGRDIPGRHKATPGFHPFVLILAWLLTVITIWISAWLPARKLSKLTPLEAIRNTGELQLKRKKKSRILAFFFGVEGELAHNALKAQKKALRTASLSLLCSFLAFTLMQCFFTISEISTRETYFERYQDAWDIMVTVKDANVEEFQETEAVQGLSGVQSAVVYQKAAAKRIVTEEEISEEMKAFGGFHKASDQEAKRVDGGWLVHAPIVILDDRSFLAYCEQLGIAPQLNGAVILNRIRDVTNPDFRHPEYMPYVKGENAASVFLQSDTGESSMPDGNQKDAPVEIPVLSYTDEVPVLREEYATQDYYELVHFMPASLWRETKGKLGDAEEYVYIRVLSKENVTLEELNQLQDRLGQTLGRTNMLESENRIQKYETNGKQIQGMKMIFGGFCILLAIIGIGDVFSNTLGFVRQRKREFARYMSVGMTPKELCKMFCAEAFVIAGRPIMITIPLAFVAVRYMLNRSYLEAGGFLAEKPLAPIVVFMLAIISAVALAYALAWRNVRKLSLAEVLKDDTML